MSKFTSEIFSIPEKALDNQPQAPNRPNHLSQIALLSIADKRYKTRKVSEPQPPCVIGLSVTLVGVKNIKKYLRNRYPLSRLKALLLATLQEHSHVIFWLTGLLQLRNHPFEDSLAMGLKADDILSRLIAQAAAELAKDYPELSIYKKDRREFKRITVTRWQDQVYTQPIITALNQSTLRSKNRQQPLPKNIRALLTDGKPFYNTEINKAMAILNQNPSIRKATDPCFNSAEFSTLVTAQAKQAFEMGKSTNQETAINYACEESAHLLSWLLSLQQPTCLYYERIAELGRPMLFVVKQMTAPLFLGGYEFKRNLEYKGTPSPEHRRPYRTPSNSSSDNSDSDSTDHQHHQLLVQKKLDLALAQQAFASQLVTLAAEESNGPKRDEYVRAALLIALGNRPSPESPLMKGNTSSPLIDLSLLKQGQPLSPSLTSNPVHTKFF